MSGFPVMSVPNSLLEAANGGNPAAVATLNYYKNLVTIVEPKPDRLRIDLIGELGEQHRAFGGDVGLGFTPDRGSYGSLLAECPPPPSTLFCGSDLCLALVVYAVK
jgi:hypothetical protein